MVIGYGSWPHGEEWLYEATSEVYIPLLDMLFRLTEEGIKANLNISFTPVLCEQLSHPAFATGFVAYLNRKIESTKGDEAYFQSIGSYKLSDLAGWWSSHYRIVLTHFTDRYHYTIMPHFKKLSEENAIEILTTPATHPLLALIPTDSAINVHLAQAKATMQKHLGSVPYGLWLPECAYRPKGVFSFPFTSPYERMGIEQLIGDKGFLYTILPSHLITGKPIGTFFASDEGASVEMERDLYIPAYIGDSNVVALFRDNITANQIWSGPMNYPRDEWYLDFHKKHFPSGNRYWRVTDPESDMVHKDVYEPIRAMDRAGVHAGHLVNMVSDMSEVVGEGLITAPFDTELFGHWWWEGLRFLEDTIRISNESKSVRLIKITDYIQDSNILERRKLRAGSWGDGGGFDTWLNDRTMWVWRLIDQTEKNLMETIDASRGLSNENIKRVLNYAVREMMFLESSDWTYLIGKNTAVEYAEMRVSTHYERLVRLLDIARSLTEGGSLSEVDRAYLCGFENISVFDNCNWRFFCD